MNFERRFSKWSEEEDKRLQMLSNRGLNSVEISEHMGRSPDSIRARLCRLDDLGYHIQRFKAHTKWSREQDIELLEGLASGLSIKKMSEKLGRTYGAVTGRLERMRKEQKVYDNKELRIHSNVVAVSEKLLNKGTEDEAYEFSRGYGVSGIIRKKIGGVKISLPYVTGTSGEVYRHWK